MWALFHKSFITNRGYIDVIKGLGNTFLIAILGLIIGILVGAVIATVKVAPIKGKLGVVLRAIADVYVTILRGTPIVVQLLIMYFVFLPAVGIAANNVVVAIIAFGLNSGAYVSEIIRSGINSVDLGQMEAARSLGFGYVRSMLYVVLPQAFKNIVPTLGNELIVLIKETSVVSFIAVLDVTKAFNSIATSNYEYVIPYLVLALVYLVIVMCFTVAIRALERRMKRSDRRS